MNRKLIAVIAALVLVVIGTIGFVTVSRLRSDRNAPAPLPPATAASADPASDKRAQSAAALPALQRAAQAKPADAAAWTKVGDAALLAQSGQIAADAYKRVLSIAPVQAGIWSSLGEAYLQYLHSDTPQMPPPAKQAFDKALTIDPNDLRARFYLATEKDVQGHHDEAIRDWVTILASVPRGSAPDRAVRATIAQSIQRNLDALNKQLETATRSQPGADAHPVAGPAPFAR